MVIYIGRKTTSSEIAHSLTICNEKEVIETIKLIPL